VHPESGASIVLRLLSDIGSLCRDFHDITVRGMTCNRVQADEICSFCGAKQKNVEMGKQGQGAGASEFAMGTSGAPVRQILTGAMCHLEAEMIATSIARIRSCRLRR
jgi:hypothetical protein